MTIVYGPVLRSYKQSFWEELNQINDPSISHWIVCGDFNAIRKKSEKSGNNFDISLSLQFNAFVQDNFLVEHPLTSRRFTWSNGTQFALLDRFFTSLDWTQTYPYSFTSDLHKNSSDHCPIVLHTSPPTHTQPYMFKFDPAWLEQEDFVQLLPKWWQEQPLSLPDIGLS